MKTLLVAGACLFALSGRRHDRSAPESGPWSGSVRFAFDFDRFTSGSGPSRQCRRRTAADLSEIRSGEGPVRKPRAAIPSETYSAGQPTLAKSARIRSPIDESRNQGSKSERI